MLYRVRHQTIYDYVQPVSVSHHVVRLTPRDLRGQRRRLIELSIWPVPPFRATTHIDYFGNTVTSFTLPESHTRMTVEASSELEVHTLAHPVFSESPAWETVRDTVASDHSPEGTDAYQFVFDSLRVSAKPELATYAPSRFPLGRPLLEAVFDLTKRIHQDFRFDPKATEVTTPVETFFEKRRGVLPGLSPTCKSPACALWDFRRAMSADICAPFLPPAAPAGRSRCLPRLVCGLVPRLWMGGFRPHQQLRPFDGHITLAWGRDYSDVSPIRGFCSGAPNTA